MITEAELQQAYRSAQIIAAGWAQRNRLTLSPCIDADDLAQEARIAVWQATKKYQPGRATFPTWACRQALCAVQHHARALSHLSCRDYQRLGVTPLPEDAYLLPMSLLKRVPSEEGEGSETFQDLLLDERETPEARTSREATWALVDTLPPAWAQVVRLHYREGRSQDQIAALIGISQMAVSRRLRKGLALLRKELR